MSKIFDAYRKKVGVESDLTLEIGRAGSVSVFPSPKGLQRDDFNKLANSLLNLRVSTRGSVFSFASSEAGEGASFVSYNTAAILANHYDQKVVWVDANFLSPQQKLVGQDSLSLGALLENPDLVANLPTSESPCVIPGGGNLKAFRGMFADQRYQKVLSNLAGHFDIVVLDLPPVLQCSETALMGANSDGMLLVIEQKFLKWEIIHHGVEALIDKGVTVLGSVINRREFVLPKFIYDRL